jgi:hypothetical protein
MTKFGNFFKLQIDEDNNSINLYFKDKPIEKDSSVDSLFLLKIILEKNADKIIEIALNDFYKEFHNILIELAHLNKVSSEAELELDNFVKFYFKRNQEQ